MGESPDFRVLRLEKCCHSPWSHPEVPALGCLTDRCCSLIISRTTYWPSGYTATIERYFGLVKCSSHSIDEI